MILIPAIDILNGKPVRLKQGDYNQASSVADSVLETAKAFEQAGAAWLHLVDLDGAKEGKPTNQALILETIQSVSIPVEIGGGIRSFEDAKAYLDGGAARVILSTAALQKPELVTQLVKLYPGQIAAGLDCLNGEVKLSGWLENSGTSIEQAIQQMQEAGIQTLIITDISKDGMLVGPSFELYNRLAPQTTCQIIASGGISNLDDLLTLERDQSVAGAIVGKAIYSGNIDLPMALKALEKPSEASSC